jgi:hypothetical protein
MIAVWARRPALRHRRPMRRRRGDTSRCSLGDVLGRRDNNGNLSIWLMNGATVATAAGLGTVPAAWTIAGVGDFTGDGSDLLWRDTAGNTAIWFIKGTAVTSSGGVGNCSGRSFGSTRTSILRATLGCLLMKPARSRVNTIW